MKNQVKIVSTIKNLSALFLVLLTPVFFLPLTQEYYTTNKIYLLAFGGLFLLLLSLIELFLSKKIIWQKRAFDNIFFLFLITGGLSVILSSPNKIQAVFNPNFGLLMLIGLFILYYYLSRNGEAVRQINLALAINLSGLVIAVVSFIFFFEPFKNVNNLSNQLLFLKNSGFTPLGAQFDLAIFLSFFVVFSLSQLITQKQRDDKRRLIVSLSFLIFYAVALLLTVFSILRPLSNQAVSTITLPPIRLSWYAAVETLKNPLTALFGVGIDNFASIYTRIKDFAYNQSTIWQIQSFSVSRSTLLHVFTETGLFGLIAFGLLLFNLIKISLHNKEGRSGRSFVIGYWLLVILFIPPSFISFFLLTIYLAYLANLPVEGSAEHDRFVPVSSTFDLSDLIPLYIGIPLGCLLLIAVSGFFLVQTYRSEYYFKQSLNAIVANNLKGLYDNQKQAVLINPYFEKYRLNFAQTNLLVANNVINRAVQAAKSQPGQPGEANKIELSAQDQQTVAQAIQAAIAEGKAAVALNPQKAGNWENLAIIYRSIMNYVQGQADAWVISSYQQAISLDPINPAYRLNLGGVYYGFGLYDDAVKLFEQATALKPDWSNAFYNLAWALFQKADYQKAALNMQNVVYLLDPKKDKTDFDKASADLAEFKKKLPEAELTPTPSPIQPRSVQLTQPSPAPTQQVEPPIKLPKEASPEAR